MRRVTLGSLDVEFGPSIQNLESTPQILILKPEVTLFPDSLPTALLKNVPD